MGWRRTPFRPGTGSPDPATFAEWTEADHPRNDQGEFVAAAELQAAKGDVAKAHFLRLEVTDPHERKKLDAIVGGGTGGHNVVLPKNPKKLTLGQMHAALVQLGYQVGERHFDQKTMTAAYDLVKPDGTKTRASQDEIRETIYQGAAGGDRRAKRPAAFDEPGHVSGIRTDALGRKRKYVDGKLVPLGDGQDGAGDVQAPAPAPSTGGGQGGRPTHQEVAAHVVGQLKPELQGNRGLAHRITLAVAKLYPHVENAAYKLAAFWAEYQNDILDTAEDFENPAKARTALGTTVGTATGNDPFGEHLGLPAHNVFPILAKVLGYVAHKAVTKIKGRPSTHAEGVPPELVDAMLELLAGLRAATGRENEPLPSREEVAAKLEEKRAARQGQAGGAA